MTLYLVGRVTLPFNIKLFPFFLKVMSVVARVIVTSLHVNDVSCPSVPYFSNLLVLYNEVEPETQKKHILSFLYVIDANTCVY